MYQHENGVSIELIAKSPAVDYYTWERFYRVTDTSTGVSCVVSTAHGRCCAFNMLSGLTNTMWVIDYIPDRKSIWQRWQVAMYDFFYARSCSVEDRAPFRMGQVFWCQNTKFKDKVVPWLVPTMTWQGASEQGHETTMFMFDFTQPVE